MHLLYDNINNYNKDEYDYFYNQLDNNYKKKIDSLIYDRDKQRSILGQILLDILLNDKYFIDYKKLEFKYNEYNKPFIDDICFNVSHSNEYSVVVTSDKRIGVDIEKIRVVDINIINYFCTEIEIKYILTSKNRYRALFEIYCLKEAYFKMIGTGISNFKEIEFIICDDYVDCNFSNLNIYLDYSIDNYIIAIVEEL